MNLDSPDPGDTRKPSRDPDSADNPPADRAAPDLAAADGHETKGRSESAQAVDSSTPSAHAAAGSEPGAGSESAVRGPGEVPAAEAGVRGGRLRRRTRSAAAGSVEAAADPGDATADSGEVTAVRGEVAADSGEAAAVRGEAAADSDVTVDGPVAGVTRKRGAGGESSGPPRFVTVAAVAALVLASVAAAWFGAGWVRAAYFTDGPRAAARDAALDAAQQAAINMTSMNIDDVAGSLAIARSSMTGPILASATEHQQQAEAMATQAGVRMESSVLGAAVTSLNSELDRASALVVLRVTEARPGEQPSGYRYTWSLDMAKDGDTWKAEQVSSLGQPVPLNDAGTSPADPAAPGAAPPGDPAHGPDPSGGEGAAPDESRDAPAPGGAPPAGEIP